MYLNILLYSDILESINSMRVGKTILLANMFCNIIVNSNFNINDSNIYVNIDDTDNINKELVKY